jgi:hypothetical protein
MDPRDFQKLALQLATAGGAAERRTAISRSYYAAFNVAANHLRSMKFPIGKGAAAHGEVRHCLANAGNAELVEAGRWLGSLHSQRIRADYELDRKDVEAGADVSANTATASNVIALLDACFGGPARTPTQAAIAAWRRANGYP